MAKRFSETTKWEDPWFLDLEPSQKLAWLYLCDCCDLAGVVDFSERLANFRIGTDVDWQEFFERCGDRIERLKSGKIFLTGFCSFQYSKLNTETSRVHQSVMKRLTEFGLQDHPKLDKAGKADGNAPRTRITRKFKGEIFTHDEFRCQCCSVHFSPNELDVMHVQKDGPNELENLVSVCVSCKAKLKNKSLDLIPYKAFIRPLDRLSKLLDRLKDKDKDKNIKNKKELPFDDWEFPITWKAGKSWPETEPKLRGVLEEFCTMRKSILKKPVKSRKNTSRIFKGFETPAHLERALEVCIANQYQGIQVKFGDDLNRQSIRKSGQYQVSSTYKRLD